MKLIQSNFIEIIFKRNFFLLLFNIVECLQRYRTIEHWIRNYGTLFTNIYTWEKKKEIWQSKCMSSGYRLEGKKCLRKCYTWKDVKLKKRRWKQNVLFIVFGLIEFERWKILLRVVVKYIFDMQCSIWVINTGNRSDLVDPINFTATFLFTYPHSNYFQYHADNLWHRHCCKNKRKFLLKIYYRKKSHQPNWTFVLFSKA